MQESKEGRGERGFRSERNLTKSHFVLEKTKPEIGHHACPLRTET